jgi:hypothetical protein
MPPIAPSSAPSRAGRHDIAVFIVHLLFKRLTVVTSNQGPIEASALLVALAEGPPAMAASALPLAATFMVTPETVPTLRMFARDMDRTVTFAWPEVSVAMATDLSIARPITMPVDSLTMATEREIEMEIDTFPRSMVRENDRELSRRLAPLPTLVVADALLPAELLTLAPPPVLVAGPAPVVRPALVAGEDPPRDSLAPFWPLLDWCDSRSRPAMRWSGAAPTKAWASPRSASAHASDDTIKPAILS